MRKQFVRGALGLMAGAVSVCTVLGVTTPALAAPVVPAPQAPAFSAPAAVPGVKITNTFWYSDRRVAMWVYSPAMGTNIQVQVLLARDWNYRPANKFPQMYMLDGLRAQDDQNGWILNTNIEDFYKDKNVNVVLPVGGESSFYTDWAEPDNGKNYQWETFLTKELPPLMESQWRSTEVRGVEGLSMGGSAAMMLSARNPGFFKFAASFSGILQLSSFGMPQAIQFAQNDAGGYDSAKMFGPPTAAAWKEHDPYVLADKLRGTSLYVSSGNGLVGQYDTPSTIPGLATNYAGVGLEVLSRVTSQQFASRLNQLGVRAQAVYRASGTHTWPYWQFEMEQAWPQAAGALGLAADKPACATGGAIAPVYKANKSLGECLTPEYDVPGGRAQDFRNGRIIWSAKTGAQVVGGAIGGSYVAAGGPGGWLGFPTSGELATPDKAGRLNKFQNGNIYWTRTTGAHPVGGAILVDWGKSGYERGPLKYPTGDEHNTPGDKGRVQDFQVGSYYWNPTNGAHSVQGKIFEKYATLGYEGGWLGFPKTNEVGLARGGKLTAFDGGNIYWTAAKGAYAIAPGPIFDAWGKAGYENGKLGYPISDAQEITGGTRVLFERGVIEVVNGVVTVK
ncbi:S-formylglutathione hydrolase FrmB [Williamsia limnetica]|uniref:S-formylglutathione hydrolase FrmB n=1 Tax=Williamsia limnetica TaxID=882452 RepID=A0A318RMD3_WILLI|nr:alpha/beta hydrolase-fold protein [Williamsia limnetica]PYE18477.1 S-formylglutathione hydrolase FrmB [Williamsia limnetica]